MMRHPALRAFALPLVLLACDEPGGRGQPLADVADAPHAVDAADTTGSPDTSTPDTAGPAPLVDPACVDGRYDEAIPTTLADLSAPLAAYSADRYLAFVDEVLAIRYPLGQLIVAEANRLGSGRFGNCVEAFTRDRADPQDLMRELSTVVHECGHILDMSRGGFSSSLYFVTEDLELECARGDTTTRGGDTFARSLLNEDEYAALLPDDFYKDVYLDGDPDDARFDSGDQGFNSVLEEAFQYVNSLATDHAFRDQLGGFSITARDGILTFLWYIERYLRLARLEHPQAYERLTTDACWREGILTLWGRAWLYLDATAGMGNLGIADDAIEELVLDPELLAEIERVRAAHACP